MMFAVLFILLTVVQIVNICILFGIFLSYGNSWYGNQNIVVLFLTLKTLDILDISFDNTFSVVQRCKVPQEHDWATSMVE